jgi:hypothetical protein
MTEAIQITVNKAIENRIEDNNSTASASARTGFKLKKRAGHWEMVLPFLGSVASV